GIFASAALSTILVVSSSPDKVIWVWLVYFITQLLEGNLILPYIMRSKVDMPEVPLLILLLIMVQWLGILGALLAPPFLAMMIILLKDFKNYQTKNVKN